MATVAGEASPSGFRRAGQALAQLYPKGISLLWLAPATLALVILPELIQHIVEIRIGMFDSIETFRSLADDPTRMAFGYVKVAGLVLAFLASARFWWTRDHGGRWWDVREVAWGRLFGGALLFFGVGSAPVLIEPLVSPLAYQLIGWGLAIVLLPALFLMLSGLLADRKPGVRDYCLRAWPWLLLTALLAVLAFAPGQWLHQMNHRWAMGADPAVTWALMLFDSLVVGVMAGLTGTALALGYLAFSEPGQSRG